MAYNVEQYQQLNKMYEIKDLQEAQQWAINHIERLNNSHDINSVLMVFAKKHRAFSETSASLRLYDELLPLFDAKFNALKMNNDDADEICINEKILLLQLIEKVDQEFKKVVEKDLDKIPENHVFEQLKYLAGMWNSVNNNIKENHNIQRKLKQSLLLIQLNKQLVMI